MEKKWKSREVVIVAIVAAVIGVIYTLMDYAYMPLAALLGPVLMELTFGIYLLSAALPAYIVRKPGFALFGALVTAAVNILLGSAYGIQVVLAGVLQALAVELVYAIWKYKPNLLCLVVSGILAGCFVFVRDYIVFGYSTLSAGVIIGMLAVRFISAAVIGTLLVKGIRAGLQKAGAMKNFKPIDA